MRATAQEHNLISIWLFLYYFLLQPKELKLNADESKALKEESGDVTMIQVHTLNY